MADTRRWNVPIRRILAALIMVIASLGAVGAPASAQKEPPEQTYEDVINNPALTPNHSIVIRLYAAVLGRQPDVAGVVFWLEAYDSGDWSLDRIANFFITSDEFQAVYGDLDDKEFTSAIYNNVLNRQPDDDGFDFWLEALTEGMARAQMVLLISNADEFKAANPLPSDNNINKQSPANEAESNLQFDFGEIDRFETINGVVWIWFDRGSFGDKVGPELQSEPRYELASDSHGGQNVNPRLRAYPLAPDAVVLVLDPLAIEAVCGGGDFPDWFNVSDLNSLVAVKRSVSLTFDDNQNVVLLRDQRAC